ncbi:RAM signaling pathway protein-domain-containing protein [Triangularia verruculosa]|uniref:RAM signaling pathway protein-domain-containing protein n=1 Tax=Triangularia verruculosa TaxID=2587418 RepID=A0AAN6XH26_9PEZI|nr:RAM signaling pathway protein-domain-containing protein [Triangularia verruculosa]
MDTNSQRKAPPQLGSQPQQPRSLSGGGMPLSRAHHQQQQQQRFPPLVSGPSDKSRDTSPIANNAPGPLLSPNQVVALVHEARRKALAQDEETRPPGTTGTGTGITLDLVGKNIPVLPDEVAEILRMGVERLAISHNILTALPAKFSQCTSLRYLAARSNSFEVFPLALCDLTSLEFLDVGRNRLRELPPDISRMTSLKALSVQENLITRLPASIANMVSLQRLRFTGNPITYPPKEILQIPVVQDQQSQDALAESETDRLITERIKKFLARSVSMSIIEAMADTGTGDESSESADTPRISSRRGGRFPVRVNGPGIVSSPGSRSASLSRPPRVSSRRSLSQYSNGFTRRPSGMIPLTMGMSSDDLWSPPELTAVSTEPRRPDTASSRTTDSTISSRTITPGSASSILAPSSASSISTDVPIMNRFSNHFRGFSYSGQPTFTNPFSPEDPSLQRPQRVRELSALPIRRYQTQNPDPTLDFFKGVLYSICQIHLGVQTLMSLTNDGTSRRSSLEIIFYNTNVYFVELEQAIQDFELSSGTRTYTRDHGSMQRAYTALIHAYVQICTRLISSVDLLVDNGDPRYMRTFLMQVYHGIMELRVAISSWPLSSRNNVPSSRPSQPPKVSPPPSARRRQASHPLPRTPRSQTPQPQQPSSLRAKRAAITPKTPMQVRTDIPYRPKPNSVSVSVSSSRSASQSYPTTTIAVIPQTPKSADSFTSAISSNSSSSSSSSPSNHHLASPPPLSTPLPSLPTPSSSSSFSTATIPPTPQLTSFLTSLRNLTTLIHTFLPTLDNLFSSFLSPVITPSSAAVFEDLISKTSSVLQQTDILRSMLSSSSSSLNYSENGPIWSTSKSLFSKWTDLGIQIREALGKKILSFGPGMVEGLRGVNKNVRRCMELMVAVRSGRGGLLDGWEMGIGSPAPVKGSDAGRGGLGSPGLGGGGDIGLGSPRLRVSSNTVKRRGQMGLPVTPRSVSLASGMGGGVNGTRGL